MNNKGIAPQESVPDPVHDTTEEEDLALFEQHLKEAKEGKRTIYRGSLIQKKA